MRSSLRAGARRLARPSSLLLFASFHASFLHQLHSSAARGAAAGTPLPEAAQSAARKTSSKRWLLHRYAPVDVRLLATAAVLSASAAVALRRCVADSR